MIWIPEKGMLLGAKRRWIIAGIKAPKSAVERIANQGSRPLSFADLIKEKGERREFVVARMRSSAHKATAGRRLAQAPPRRGAPLPEGGVARQRYLAAAKMRAIRH